MGCVKNAAFPYYEELLQEFEEKHDRHPNSEEQGKIWEQAIDRLQDGAIAAAEAHNGM